jgi:hypothetical protein
MTGRGPEEQGIPNEIGREEGVPLLQLVFEDEVLTQDADQNPFRQEAIREVVFVVAAEEGACHPSTHVTDSIQLTVTYLAHLAIVQKRKRGNHLITGSIRGSTIIETIVKSGYHILTREPILPQAVISMIDDLALSLRTLTTTLAITPAIVSYIVFLLEERIAGAFHHLSLPPWPYRILHLLKRKHIQVKRTLRHDLAHPPLSNQGR